MNIYIFYLISTYNHELSAKLEYKGESHTLFANWCTPATLPRSVTATSGVTKGQLVHLAHAGVTDEFIPM